MIMTYIFSIAYVYRQKCDIIANVNILLQKGEPYFMEETISLQELAATLKKHVWLILLAMIAAVTVAAIVSFLLMTPIYQASTQILVNQEKTEQTAFTAQDIQTNVQLINTYNVIMKSPAILGLVKEQLNLTESTGQLNQKMTISSEQNSQVITLTVEDADPYQAEAIANKTAEVFQQEIVELMSVDNVNILAPANVGDDPSPVKPSPTLNMAIAAVVGLMLGVGIAFLLEYLDTTVKSVQTVDELTGYPVIGMIATISDKDIQSSRVQLTNRRRTV